MSRVEYLALLNLLNLFKPNYIHIIQNCLKMNAISEELNGDPAMQQTTVQIGIKMICKGCTKYIEKIIFEIEGTLFAHCDYKNGIAEIGYNPLKTNINKIEKSISDAGYDTLNLKREVEFYTEKPKCCEYSEGLGSDDDFRA